MKKNRRCRKKTWINDEKKRTTEQWRSFLDSDESNGIYVDLLKISLQGPFLYTTHSLSHTQTWARKDRHTHTYNYGTVRWSRSLQRWHRLTVETVHITLIPFTESFHTSTQTKHLLIISCIWSFWSTILLNLLLFIFCFVFALFCFCFFDFGYCIQYVYTTIPSR